MRGQVRSTGLVGVGGARAKEGVGVVCRRPLAGPLMRRLPEQLEGSDLGFALLTPAAGRA